MHLSANEISFRRATGLLANARRYEEITVLEDKRVGYPTANIHEILEAAKSGAKADEVMQTLEYLAETASESIKESSVFSYDARKKVLNLAWSTLREVAELRDRT